MHLKHSLFLLIFLLCSFISASSIYAYNNNDFQYWPRLAIDAGLQNNWKFVLFDEVRIGDNSTKLYQNHAETGLINQLSDYVSVGAKFRYVYTRGTNGTEKWNSEYWPIMEGTAATKSGPTEFLTRNRFEYRIIEGQANKWWYRNYLELTFPVIAASIKLRPYIGNEFFFELNNTALKQNRIYAGLKMKFGEHISTDLYYLRYYFKKPDWKAYNVFGSKLKFIF